MCISENEEQASLLETSGDHDGGLFVKLFLFWSHMCLEKESMNPIQLFQKSLWKTTSLLWVVWLCFGFSYYGTVLIMPKVILSRLILATASNPTNNSARYFLTLMAATLITRPYSSAALPNWSDVPLVHTLNVHVSANMLYHWTC